MCFPYQQVLSSTFWHSRHCQDENKLLFLAEKLTKLRKKAGWSQEELAEQMNVTRQ